MLQERTIEMVERAEEAVVEKVANVREEVVVTKTAEERTEQIEDIVRRTEVEVEDGRKAGDRPAFSGFGGNTGSERDGPAR
jgi:stress response protein YsnF